MRVCFRVTRQLFLPNFGQNRNIWIRFSKNRKYERSRKSCVVRIALLGDDRHGRTDRRMHVTKLMVLWRLLGEFS
jgi:hypothetical protein